MRGVMSFTLLLGLAQPILSADPSISLVMPKPGGSALVEVAGLSKDQIAKLKSASPGMKEWPALFRVVVAGGTDAEVLARPPLAGTHALTDTGIRFEPQFPLVPGREYIAILQLDPSAKPLRVTISLTRPPAGPRVAITAVYPSANRLPENTLRFYIHFSGPVARGDVYRHLKLIRDDGVEVKDPFLELDEELWSTDGNRLTVLFHPGRVKRELVPREQEGAILEEGRRYTLTISKKWEDLEGRPLVADYRKSFTAGPPDDEMVKPGAWALMAPRAGSDAPLIVRLPKPLDHAMLGRVVWVADAAGKPVPGELTVGGGERVLTFAPKGRWGRGEYRLMGDSMLEDMCGNSVARPFEVDVFRPVTRSIESKTFERPFTVR